MMCLSQIILLYTLISYSALCQLDLNKPKRKNTYFCSIDYANAFDCVHHNKLWKILKEMEI